MLKAEVKVYDDETGDVLEENQVIPYIKKEKVTAMCYRYLFAFEVCKLDEHILMKYRKDDENGHM